SSPLFFFQRSRGHPALHSFPTRRSSDLALQVKAKVPEAVGVFILPPSRAALEERMRKRGQDSEEVIARRMANARGEMAHHGDFDYLIVNEVFDTAVDEMGRAHVATPLTGKPPRPSSA